MYLLLNILFANNCNDIVPISVFAKVYPADRLPVKYDGIDFSSLLVLSKYCLPTYFPSRLKLRSFVGW